MGKYRKGRLDGEILRQMTEILRDVKDPRVSDNFLSVTAVDCTPDMKNATIYYSHLTGEDKEVAEGLKNATGFIRRELSLRANLRITPELLFKKDDSMTYAAHIEKVLSTLNIQPEEEDSENQPDSDTSES